MLIVMFIMAVTTLCRLNLSIAGKYIAEEFSFDTITMGHIFSAFLWGYGFFQVPWGYIGDRFGPRRTLATAMLLFCIGAAMVPLAPRLALGTGVSVSAGVPSNPLFHRPRRGRDLCECHARDRFLDRRARARFCERPANGGSRFGRHYDAYFHFVDDGALGLAHLFLSLFNARFLGTACLVVLLDRLARGTQSREHRRA